MTRLQADLSRVIHSTEHFSRTFYPRLIHFLILPVHVLSGGLLLPRTETHTTSLF